MRRLVQVWLVSAVVLPGFPVSAQAGNIPQAVIDECNAEARASDLPKCLKNGAIAFEMLALARSDPFYGEAASRVIATCREKNYTFHKTWTCFENAAEKAVETRELIGRENIADACVSGISDPDVYAELDATSREKRDARFPDEIFFGGVMYHPFQSCPRDAAVLDAYPVFEGKPAPEMTEDALPGYAAITPEMLAAGEVTWSTSGPAGARPAAPNTPS